MTVTEIQDRLALYIAAEQKILEGNQSYQVGAGSLPAPICSRSNPRSGGSVRSCE